MPIDFYAYRLEVPLLAPFIAAGTELSRRQVILVFATDGPIFGWGEAAPFPEMGVDDVDTVWAALVHGTKSAMASAAVDEAERDVDARREGSPLWAALGGSSEAVIPSLAIGLGSDGAETVAAAAAAGYGAVKLKVEPGNDVDRVRTARQAAPDVIIGIDANGSYRDQTAPIRQMAELGASYVEQPFARGALAATARLRAELEIPILLDEDVRSIGDAERILGADAADGLVVKPGVLGIEGCLRVHQLATDAGLMVKASGFIETGVGRAHTRAIAALPGARFSDIAPATAFLEHGLVRPEVDVAASTVARPEPGIGVDVDQEALRRYVVEESPVSDVFGSNRRV